MQPHQQPHQQTSMDPLALLMEARRKLAANDELRNYGSRQGVGEGLDHHRGGQQHMRSAMDVSTKPGPDTKHGATSCDSTVTSDSQRRPILARRDTQTASGAGLGQLAELVREAQHSEVIRRSFASSGELVMPQQRLQARSNTELSPVLQQKKTFDREPIVLEELELQRRLAALREQQLEEIEMRAVQSRSNELPQRLEPQKDRDIQLHQRFSTEMEHDLQLRLNEAHRELELQRRLSAQLESNLKLRFGSLREQERQQLLNDQEADGEWDAQNDRLNARLEQEASQRASGVSPSRVHHRRQFLSQLEEEKYWPQGNSDRDTQQRALAEYRKLTTPHKKSSALKATDVDQRLDESVLAQRPRSVSRQRELKRLLALQRQTTPGNTMTSYMQHQHKDEPWRDQVLREELDSYTRTSDDTVTEEEILERELERLSGTGGRGAASRYSHSRDRSSEQRKLEIEARGEVLRRTPSVSRASSRQAQSDLLDYQASRSSNRRAREAEESKHKRSASASRRSSSRSAVGPPGDEQASRHSKAHYGSRRNSNHLQKQQESRGQARKSRELLEEEADLMRVATKEHVKKSHRREVALDRRDMGKRATRHRSVMKPELHRYERYVSGSELSRRHGSRRRSGNLLSSSNEQGHIRSLSELSKQKQLERDHINDVRSPASSLKSTRNAMEIDADLTSSSDEDDEDQHRGRRDSRATPRRSHPEIRRPSQVMQSEATKLRQSEHPYESSAGLGSSETEPSSDSDTERDRRRPNARKVAAVGSQMAQTEASSMPDSSDENSLKQDATRPGTKPGREATEDRSAKRRPSDQDARRRSLEPKLPRAEGSGSQKRGSLRTNPGEPVHGATRQSRRKHESRRPESTSDEEDEDDTLRAVDDRYPSTDSDSDSEELDRRRQERIRLKESSTARTAKRDARRRRSSGGSQFPDTGDSSRTEDADEATALDRHRAVSWRSKHNKAAADSTQESEQRAPREETRETDSDDSDHSDRQRDRPAPPPLKPDTGSKVQLLDRTKLMQAAASKDAVDRSGGRHSANSDKDRDMPRESDKDKGKDKGKEKEKDKDKDKEKEANLSLVAKRALFKTVNRVPAVEHAPTQVKPEDTLTEEDIEACKTRAQKKNEDRRKRKEPPQEEQQGQLAAPAAADEQSEQMNSGPVDEEEDDVAPLMQKEAGRGEPAPAPAPAHVEAEPDEADDAPVTGNTAREDKTAEQAAPPPASDGDQGVMALEQERKKSVVKKVPKPPPPPPREEQQQLARQPQPPPPPQQQVRAKPVPTEATRAPLTPPPPPKQQQQPQRKRSRPRKVSAASIEPQPPPPMVVCCPCPPPQPTSCCRRCGVACCYGSCCMRCRPC